MLRFFRTPKPTIPPSGPAGKVAAAVAVALSLHGLGLGQSGKIAAAVAVALRLHSARQRPLPAQPTAWSLSGRIQHMSARVGLQATPRASRA